MVKRWCVINAYTVANAGDAAITLGTQVLAREVGGADIHVASRYAARDASFYAAHGISAGPPPVAFPVRGTASAPGPWRALVFLWSLVWAVVVSLAYRACPTMVNGCAFRALGPGLRAMLTADVVVVAGGGYLYSAKRKVNLTLIHSLVSMILPVLAGKSILVMPQSIGPLDPTGRTFASLALGALPVVVVREPISRDFARTGLGVRRMRMAPDVAFTLAGQRGSHPRGPDVDTPVEVAVVPMDWTWARRTGTMELETYVAKMADLVVGLNVRGVAVRIVGSSRVAEEDQDDLAVGRRILDAGHGRGATQVVVVTTATVDEFVEAVAPVRVVVGTRLHACILAITAGRPAVALGYQPKTSGTYEMLGLAQYAHDVERFSVDEVLAQTLSLAEDASVFAGAGERAARQVLDCYRDLDR